jgi:hypothetical protein
VAFRFVAPNEHPDHDTIAAFRRRFLKDLTARSIEALRSRQTTLREILDRIDPSHPVAELPI